MRVQEAGQSPVTVLIVGDNVQIAELTLTVLSELGPTGLTVPDVPAAVCFLNGRSADVAAVIADGDLDGDLSGAEFARFVRLAWPGIRVAVTARHGEPESRPAPPADDIARFTSPILPLEVISFLHDASLQAQAA